MKTKEEMLAELQENIRSGAISVSDLQSITPTQAQSAVAVETPQPKGVSETLSAVDVMFYVAGIVLFSTILSTILQSWNDANPLLHILLSAVVGLILWTVALFLIKRAHQNDILSGLTNALLLTGSLLSIVGGYIITNELLGGYGEINYIPATVTLLALGGLHMWFDTVIKRDLILLMGILLSVGSIPALLFGLLQDVEPAIDIWAMVMIVSAVVLFFTTRLVANIKKDRQEIRHSLDAFAAFLALIAMYIASYGENDIIWLILLIGSVLGIFFLSVALQNRHLLGNASFFMVLTIITIAFKYFSGYGITFSLVVATFGLLASAALASTLNKKYFKSKQLPEVQ